MKATIKNVPEDEVDSVIAIAHKYNGVVTPVYKCSSTVDAGIASKALSAPKNIIATFDKSQDITGFDIAVSDLGYQLDWKKNNNKQRSLNNTYFLVVEFFDRYNSQFAIAKVQATSVSDAIKRHLELDHDISQQDLTVEGQKGYYAGEEYTIGVGISEQQAALQYVTARIKFGG